LSTSITVAELERTDELDLGAEREPVGVVLGEACLDE